MASFGYHVIACGAEIATVQFLVTRADLVRYCGASGDFNPIHWNERIAKAVGLPDVIAHGMFTMAETGRFVTDWAGPQGAVPGVVAEKPDRNGVRLALTARSSGSKVLTRSRAVVRLP